MTAEEDALLRTLEARVTQVTLDRLQTDYANLKTAKMIDISSEDMKNAKSRLSKLVREVDKCIALLNV